MSSSLSLAANARARLGAEPGHQAPGERQVTGKGPGRLAQRSLQGRRTRAFGEGLH